MDLLTVEIIGATFHLVGAKVFDSISSSTTTKVKCCIYYANFSYLIATRHKHKNNLNMLYLEQLVDSIKDSDFYTFYQDLKNLEGLSDPIYTILLATTISRKYKIVIPKELTICVKKDNSQNEKDK